MGLPVLQVDVDSREKQPLLFPKTVELYDENGTGELHEVKTNVIRLDAGDYRLTSWPNQCGIETKRSLAEVRQNEFSRDRYRASNALHKLSASYRNPYLLLEISQVAMRRSSPRWDETPAAIIQRLMAHIDGLGIGLLWIDSPSTMAGRIMLGETVLWLLWSHVVHQRKLDRVEALRKKSGSRCQTASC